MVEYRRLTADDVDQVLDMQRRVFGVSDADLIPGPLLRLVARDEPPLGLQVGAFRSDTGALVGAMLGFAAFEPGTVYGVMIGVMPEYQNGPYGTKLFLLFREEAMSRGLNTMYGVFDLLDTRLGRLYAGGLGFVGTKLLGDKLFCRWDFSSPHVVAKLGRAPRQAGGSELLLPIGQGSAEEQEKTLAVAREYLNERNYVIMDCVTDRSGEERISSYVMRPTS